MPECANTTYLALEGQPLTYLVQFIIEREILFSVAPGDVNVTGQNIVSRGDVVIFNCSNSGGPSNSYQWLSNNTIISGENSSLLFLGQVNASDGGVYMCLVTNRAGNDTSSITLNIEPYITIFPTIYMEVELSDPAMFFCSAEGFPAPDIVWVKIDTNLTGPNTVSTTGNLDFSSVVSQDNGTYFCQAISYTTAGIELQTATTPETILIGTAVCLLCATGITAACG